MNIEYLKKYKEIKAEKEREIKRQPNKEHELTLLYSPVINYYAVNFIEDYITNEIIYGLRDTQE